MVAAGFQSLCNTSYEDLIRELEHHNPNTTMWCQAHGLISQVEVSPTGMQQCDDNGQQK